MELVTTAVLMVGGEGRRLRPLTEKIPKPMLRVCGVPILEIILQRLITAGIRQFYFCVNYLQHIVRGHFGDGSNFGVKIDYVTEAFPMGTVGALSNITMNLSKPFLLMNGDVYTDLDFNDFFFHFHNSGAVFFVCSRLESVRTKYGILSLDGEDDTIIKDICEKPTKQYSINCGIYACQPEILEHIPKGHYFGADLLIKELAIAEKNIRKYDMNPDSVWFDIGTPDDYKEFVTFMEAKETWKNPKS